MSGGGITLLSSNSVTTLRGRIDLDKLRRIYRTRAIANPWLLSFGTAVSTSFPASIDLPRFEMDKYLSVLISHPTVPDWISTL